MSFNTNRSIRIGVYFVLEPIDLGADLIRNIRRRDGTHRRLLAIFGIHVTQVTTVQPLLY